MLLVDKWRSQRIKNTGRKNAEYIKLPLNKAIGKARTSFFVLEFLYHYLFDRNLLVLHRMDVTP